MGFVPGVDFKLQTVAFGEQEAVFRRQIVDKGIDAFPERIDIDSGAG